jgi:nucleoside 2-deoxyribosyltransferase
MEVYWANSIFSEADREFNAKCVDRLRESGFIVLDPQENPFNRPQGISNANEVFETDTQMISNCDVFVACIDQETIDAGVACELGIAWAQGKMICALYTDFRQFRTGEFRMYKNSYVIGCIKSKGHFFSTIGDLVQHLEDIRDHGKGHGATDR